MKLPRRWHLLMLLILVTSLLLLITSLTQEGGRNLDNVPLASCSEGPEKYLWTEQLIINDNPDGGLGNRLFEMISFVMLSRHLGRKPVIDFHAEERKNRRLLLEFFPYLQDAFSDCQVVDPPETIEIGVELHFLPFIDFPAKLDALLPDWREQKIVHLHSVELLQSHRYFYNKREEVLNLLRFDRRIGKRAERMITGSAPDDLNVCVHIRRGDFIYQKFHQHSTSNFTREATMLVLRKERVPKKRVRLIVFGNDHPWARRALEHLPPDAVDYPIEFIVDAPQNEWAISRRHCNAVLLTAPTSTFGWWLAYFSSRQSHVYYSSKFTKRNFTAEEFVRDDLIPREWREIPSYDSGSDDIPWTHYIPFYERTHQWWNYFVRSHFNVLYRV